MRLDSVVILGSARTAIGSFGGSLAGLAPHELGTVTAREALARAGVEAGDIDHAVYGHIITTGPQDAYLARHIALEAGVPEAQRRSTSTACAAPACRRSSRRRSRSCSATAAWRWPAAPSR